MWMAKAAAVAAALVLMLVCAACNGGSEATMELDSAEAIVAKMMEAETTLETYKSEATVDGKFAVNIPGEDAFSMEMDVSGTMDTVVDTLNQETAMTMEFEMTPGEGRPGRIPMTMDYYLVDETLYYKLYSPIYSMDWVKTGMPGEHGNLLDEYTSQMDTTQLQLDMLELADVDLIGSEGVEGTDCYVLDVAPDFSAIRGLYMDMAGLQAGMEDFSAIESMMETVWNDMVEKYTMRLWVAKDTLYPAKTEMGIEMTMDAETIATIMEATEGQKEEFEDFYLHVDMTMTAFMHDYNAPISIELPPEAEDAVDLSYYEDGWIEGGW
jgi:hypothetical protein